jgi:hypothetical protein
VVTGILPHWPVTNVILISNRCSGVTQAIATVIFMYIYIYIYIYCLRLPLSRVHSEFLTLFVLLPGKTEKRGKVLILFFLKSSLLESKFMSLLKFFFLFRCVFEAMLMVKVNLGFINFFA